MHLATSRTGGERSYGKRQEMAQEENGQTQTQEKAEENPLDTAQEVR
jgi:hypothetical protein